MPNDQILYEKFLEIEKQVFNGIIDRSNDCPGPSCNPSKTPPKGYKCKSCGTGVDQGYLSKDAGDDFPPLEIANTYIDILENIKTGDKPKDKFTIEAIKLNNLDLQISAKIKELYDLQTLVISLNEIINNEIKNLQ